MKKGDYVLLVELPQVSRYASETIKDFFVVNRLYKIKEARFNGTFTLMMLDGTSVDYGVTPIRFINLSMIMSDEELLRFIKLNKIIETVPI